MTPATELDRLFRDYAEQLKRTPTPDAPEPMEETE